MPPYLMWFTRFGNPHLQTMWRLDDCYDLAYALDNADTATFDSYGILDYVEHVTLGVIPEGEWDAGLAEYIKVARLEYAAEQKANPSLGEIRISAPPAMRSHGWETYRTYTDEAKMMSEYSALAGSLGPERVSVVWH